MPTTNTNINSGKQETVKFQSEGWIFAVIICACLFLFFNALGSWGLIDPGDGYFTAASREMMESGNYVVPHLNYQIYFSKPILIYWLITSAYHLFGINEFAGRFWSALLATILCLCTYWCMRCLAGKRTGLIAALVLASSPLVVTFARMSLIDMSFSSLMGIALCAVLMTVFVGSKKWWPVIYVSLALAVLDKGPAGLVLFALGVVPFLLLHRPDKSQLQNWFKSLHVVWGSLIFLAIALPWYLAVGMATNWLFLKVFLLYENLGRFAGQTNHKHPEYWYYLPVLTYGFFPWVLFLPPALTKAFKTKTRSSAALFLACWATSIFLFFTFSTAKLETYILPAFTALAMLVALLLSDWIESAEVTKWLKTVSLMLVVIAIVIFGAALVGCFAVKHVEVFEKLIIVLAALILLVGWLRQYLFMRQGDVRRCITLLTVTAVIACSMCAPIAFMVGYQLKQKDLHDVAMSMAGKDARIAIFREFKPTLMYYLQQPIDSFFDPYQLEKAKDPAIKQYVIASDKSLPELIAAHGNKLLPVCVQGHWGMYEAQGLSLRKLPTLEQTFALNLNLNSGEYSWGTLPFAGGTLPKNR